MKLLLDTHAFLWFVLDDPRLSTHAKALIADPGNDITMSPASCWEIAIKISLGKYQLNEPYQALMERELITNHFQLLPIEVKHIARLTTLPFHHRDPFDRLLVAQAIAEDLPLVSGDATLDAYPITRRW